MLRRAVAVDGVEQALALVAGVEPVGVDLGQRAVRRERQVLEVARQAEQRRVARRRCRCWPRSRCRCGRRPGLAAVPAEQQDVDPLLGPEGVGGLLDGRRLAVVGEDAPRSGRAGRRPAAGPTTAGSATAATSSRTTTAPRTCRPREVRARQQHPVAGDDHDDPQQGAQPTATAIQSSHRCRRRAGRRSAVPRSPARRRPPTRSEDEQGDRAEPPRPAARNAVPGRTAPSAVQPSAEPKLRSARAAVEGPRRPDRLPGVDDGVLTCAHAPSVARGRLVTPAMIAPICAAGCDGTRTPVG